MTNEILREHVTSIGFSLTLSKSMIDHLVLLHHFKGDKNAIYDAGFLYHPLFRSWTTTSRCLQERGLTTHRLVRDKQGYVINAFNKPTKAGTLVVNLLKEAGLYQERIAELLTSIQEGRYHNKAFPIVKLRAIAS